MDDAVSHVKRMLDAKYQKADLKASVGVRLN